LQLLLLIGELGSISKAAQRLSISQQAATEMLKDLETAFGAKLFARSARGVLHTTAGLKVAGHAALAMKELNLAQSDVRLQIETRPRLRVGFSHGILYTGLPAAVALFQSTNPFVNLSLKESTVIECVIGLMQGALDVVITINHPNFLSPSSLEPLTVIPLIDSYHYSAFASRDLAKKLGSKVTLKSLVQKTWLYPSSESMIRHIFDDWFIQRGAYPPSYVVEVHPTLRALEFLRHMEGIAMLPTPIAQQSEFNHVSALQIKDLQIPLRRVFACSDADFRRAEVQSLLHCIKTVDDSLVTLDSI